MIDLNFLAYAANAASGTANQGRGLLETLPFIFIMLGVFYFIAIRPNQKKEQAYREQLKALKVGDKVLINPGIYATIEGIGENQTYYVQIASGVKIHIISTAIYGKIEEKKAKEEDNKATDSEKKVEKK